MLKFNLQEDYTSVILKGDETLLLQVCNETVPDGQVKKDQKNTTAAEAVGLNGVFNLFAALSVFNEAIYGGLQVQKATFHKTRQEKRKNNM